jgi:hypothetical protein
VHRYHRGVEESVPPQLGLHVREVAGGDMCTGVSHADMQTGAHEDADSVYTGVLRHRQAQSILQWQLLDVHLPPAP